MSLAELLGAARCEAGARYAGKDACLAGLARQAASALAVDPSGVLQALLQREGLGSTGLGAGVALPHARLEGVAGPYVSVTSLREAIAFDAIDGRPVDVVCLVLLPTEGSAGIDVLAYVARRLRDRHVLAGIRGAEDAHALSKALQGPLPT